MTMQGEQQKINLATNKPYWWCYIVKKGLQGLILTFYWMRRLCSLEVKAILLCKSFSVYYLVGFASLLFIFSLKNYRLETYLQLVTYAIWELQIGDNCSRRNVHEAEFLVALCRHLILQGYEPNNITMLTTYTAQMFYMKTVSTAEYR